MGFGGASDNLEEQTVRALIKKFADSRNAHAGQAAAATYSEDGEYIWEDPAHATRGRTALAALRGGLPSQMSRTINNVEFLAPNIAVVRVDAQAFGQAVKFIEILLVVKDEGEWTIRVHQALPPGARN